MSAMRPVWGHLRQNPGNEPPMRVIAGGVGLWLVHVGWLRSVGLLGGLVGVIRRGGLREGRRSLDGLGGGFGREGVGGDGMDLEPTGPLGLCSVLLLAGLRGSRGHLCFVFGLQAIDM
ncbi:hypothetical protein Tco_0110852 [Tanacetum coccineum]